MLKHGISILALVFCIMVPAMAGAGTISASVATGSASGTVNPSGGKYYSAAQTFTMTSGSGYALNYITDNSVKDTGSQRHPSHLHDVDLHD